MQIITQQCAGQTCLVNKNPHFTRRPSIQGYSTLSARGCPHHHPPDQSARPASPQWSCRPLSSQARQTGRSAPWKTTKGSHSTWPGGCRAHTFLRGPSPDLLGPAASQTHSASIRQGLCWQWQTGSPAPSWLFQLSTGGQRGRSRLEAKGSGQRCRPTLLGRGATAGRAGGLWEEGPGTVPHQAPGRRPSPGNVLCISFTDCLSGRRQSLHPAAESASAKAKLVSLKAQKLRKWNLAPPVLG